MSYAYDKAGRVSTVNGAGYFGVTNYANSLTYRAFGALKGMNYPSGRSLSTAYDYRLRPTMWNVSSVLGYNYKYDYFNERTGRVTYAQNIASGGGATNGAADPTLDRSYEYDNVGRLVISHSGTEARAHVGLGSWGTMDGPYSQGYDYDVWGNVTHKYGWGGEVQGGGAGQSSDIYYSYTGNRRNGFSYDAAGNLTNDLGQNFTYDVTGQQTNASYSGYSLVQSYDGDGLRVKKNDNGAVTYYLRSSVLGGQVVAELNGGAVWMRGYVYLGSQLLAVQDSGVYWMHEDPVTKSKRVTNSAGAVVSTIELDPWGANTNRSSNSAFQPHKFTSYERDGNGSDEAMFRRYNRWQSRFDQPDPYDGSYDYSDPQSFNRYAYVQNDPVNFVDPSGLLPILVCGYTWVNGELGYLYNCSIREVPEPSDPRDPPGGGGKGDRPPTDPEGKANSNCIANAVAGGKLAGRGLEEAISSVTGPSGLAIHDGEHVLVPAGTTGRVTALRLMAGRILHSGRQSGDRTSPSYPYSVVDILLNTLINGQQYVMTLKDMFYEGGRLSGNVNSRDVLGSVEGHFNPNDEAGLHVTLYPYSVYRQYIQSKGFGPKARNSVPFGSLMSAGHDPLSPFHCP